MAVEDASAPTLLIIIATTAAATFAGFSMSSLRLDGSRASCEDMTAPTVLALTNVGCGGEATALMDSRKESCAAPPPVVFSFGSLALRCSRASSKKMPAPTVLDRVSLRCDGSTTALKDLCKGSSAAKGRKALES